MDMYHVLSAAVCRADLSRDVTSLNTWRKWTNRIKSLFSFSLTKPTRLRSRRVTIFCQQMQRFFFWVVIGESLQFITNMNWAQLKNVTCDLAEQNRVGLVLMLSHTLHRREINDNCLNKSKSLKYLSNLKEKQTLEVLIRNLSEHLFNAIWMRHTACCKWLWRKTNR